MNIGIVFQKHFIDNEADGNNILVSLSKLNIPNMIIDNSLFSSELFTWDKEPVDIIVFIGTINFVKNFGKIFKSNIPCFSFFSNEFHKYSSYQYLISKDVLLNHDGFVLPYSEIKKRGYKMLNKISNSKDIILKPDNCLKITETSSVSNNEDFEKWLNITEKFSGINESSFFWIFPKSEIINETRCIIYKNKLVSASFYIKNGEIYSEINKSKELEFFVNEQAKNFDFQDEIFVLDVAEVKRNEILDFKIIELNCLSTSGTYKINKDIYINKIVSAVKDYYLEYYT